MTEYSITVSETELAIIALAIGRVPTARKVATRASATPPATYRPTGPEHTYTATDPDTDAWLSAHHDPAFKPWVPAKRAIPRPPKLGPGRWAAVEREWNDAAHRAVARMTA